MTMDRHERQMLGYAHLAHLAGHSDGRVRFLILCGTAACRAGYADVAARCRDAILALNPRHLAARWETLADALRDAEFDTFLRSVERQCPWERSEHELAARGIDLDDTADATLTAVVESLLPSGEST